MARYFYRYFSLLHLLPHSDNNIDTEGRFYEMIIEKVIKGYCPSTAKLKVKYVMFYENRNNSNKK